jgi:hypothetical protein
MRTPFGGESAEEKREDTEEENITTETQRTRSYREILMFRKMALPSVSDPEIRVLCVFVVIFSSSAFSLPLRVLDFFWAQEEELHRRDR